MNKEYNDLTNKYSTIKDHIKSQDELLKEQDKQFDLIYNSANNLHIISLGISKELHDQEQYIENLSNSVSGAQISLLRNNQKLNNFSKKNKCFPCTLL